jgi:hypothetical protein
MNFAGAKPIVIPRYGSKCQWDDSTQLPLGLADIARNVRYTAQSVATRFGHSTRIQITQGDAITAVGLLRYLAAEPGTLNLSAVETVLLMAYDAVNGNIYTVAPFIQATLATLTNAGFYTNTGLAPVLGANPVFCQCFNVGLVAMGDLLLPKSGPLVYLPITSTLYPASDLPFGSPWTPNTFFRVGQIVSPSSFQTFGQPGGQGAWVEEQTGFVYQCIQAGTSGAANAQPVWPTTFDGQVVDNTTKWQECTPIFCSGLPDPGLCTGLVATANAGSPIAPGARVYLAATYVNPKGEGINALITTQGVIDATKVLVYTNNTGGNVQLDFDAPAIPTYLQPTGPLGVAFGATGLNIYAYIDNNPTTDSNDPSNIIDSTFYGLINTGGPVAGGAAVTLSAYPGGQQLPQTSTAATSANVGNVDTGIRYLAVMFMDQTGCITGFSNSAPVPLNVTQSGWPITVLRLPTGPYQMAARVVPSTVAGASAAGPYTYVSQADVESPGFNQPSVKVTATLVEDNTTTVTEFNFTDTYLPGASNVTNYFTRTQIPPCVDVYFAKSLQRTVYTGAVGYQSGHLFSDIADPMAVRIPGGNLQVSENDGDRCVCFREVRGIPISFKENGGFAVETNSGDPSTWGVRQLWSGTGPAGPKAIDIAGADVNGTGSEFAMWAHRGGVNIYMGTTPSLIGRELLEDWETINWSYGHLISLRIDHVRRLAYILAPTGNSTICNARWTLNYFFGTSDPVVFVPRRGTLVPNVEGRKWSQDDFTGFTFNDAVYIPQKSLNAVQQVGLDVNKEMVFVASDGSIKTVTESQYYDEAYDRTHEGYTSEWRGVLGDTPGLTLSKCIGGKFWAIGNGLCNLIAYDDNLNPYPITGPLSPFILAPNVRTRVDLPILDATALSNRWAVSFDNGGVAGAWWQMLKSDLYKIDMWDSLPG